MLTNPEEIAIIQNAKQKNVRDPRRSREHFFSIFLDFFSDKELNGRYIDLGPGQYDFGEIVRKQGGRCLGVDMDPAVIALGKYKGFDTLEMNLKSLPDNPIKEQFDGVWNKFSLNAFWAWDSDIQHESIVNAICNCMSPEAWGWIAPWNGVPKKAGLSADKIREVVDLQQRLFENRGYTTVPLSLKQAKKYGVNGDVANNVVFIKNLKVAS